MSSVLDHFGNPASSSPSANGSSNGLQPRFRDGFALPHVISFGSILASGWRAFWHGRHDEAMRHERENALAMWNDVQLQGLMQERSLAVASLPWRIEVPDEKDPLQKQVQDGITTLLENFHKFELFLYCLEYNGVWYGRTANQVVWDWGTVQQRRALQVKQWKLESGDSLGFLFDNTPYLLLNAAESNNLPNAEIITTNIGGRGLVLRGSWRERFILHTHIPEAADFWEPERATAIHGVGIRSHVYFHWFMKQEWLSQICDVCERAGTGGIELWYFDLGNPESEKAVRTAAEKTVGTRTRVLVPRIPDSKQTAMEIVQVSMTGAEFLLKLVEAFDEYFAIYIVGQTLSDGSDNQSGLGGSGRAKFAESTKLAIRNFDAKNLAATITGDDYRPGLISMMQKWTWPETWPSAHNPNGFRAKFVFSLESQESSEKLQAIGQVIDRGAPVRIDDMYSAAGIRKPGETDEVVGGQQPGAGMPGQEGMPGQPGQEMAGMPGDPAAMAGAAGDAGAAGAMGEDPNNPTDPTTLPEIPADDDALLQQVATMLHGDPNANQHMAQLQALLNLVNSASASVGPDVVQYNQPYDENKHERGHTSPDKRGVVNPGQFAPKGQGGNQPSKQHGQDKPAAAASKPASKPAATTQAKPQAQQPKTTSAAQQAVAKAKQVAGAASRKVSATAQIVAHHAKQLLDKLPGPVKMILQGYLRTRWGIYLGAQKLAHSIAEQKGGKEHADKTARVLLAADLALQMAGTPAAPFTSGVSLTSSVVPMASVGYCLFSAATNPTRTAAAARQVVAGVMAKRNRSSDAGQVHEAKQAKQDPRDQG